MKRMRRHVLAGVGGILGSSLAGCLAEPEQQSADDTVYASFFTLQEFTKAVVADRTVESAVPVGSHGHGWEPPASLLPDIVDTAAFVYLDAAGFQHWVDDTLPDIEAEYSDEVMLIDVLERIDLLEYDGDDHDHGGYDIDDYELAVRSISLSDRDGEELADAHGDHWHGTPIAVPRDEEQSITVEIRDEGGDPIEFGDRYQLGIRVVGGDDSVIDTTAETSDDDQLILTGQDDGFVELVVQVYADDEVVYETPPLKTEVGAHSHDHGDHDHGHDHDHSHGEYDAKFFSDPVLAQRGVETIRDGLIELDPANEDVYQENAREYIAELEDLHQEYERRLADREHDVVVLAGHDSFQYLGERYGFEIHTPVGLSPDEEPAGSRVAETVEFIEERGIEYVLWDYFDGDRLANTIADEADTVEESLMVSPTESTTEAWLEDGYGSYLGQMREINLPAFEKALGAI